MSCKHHCTIMYEPILIKLHIVAKYNLRMCMMMKEDNPSPKNIKEDESREIIILIEQGYPFVF